MSVHTRNSSLYTGNTYFSDYTTTNAYAEISFGFPANQISLANDSSSDNVRVSWDGTTLHHELHANEYKDLPANGRTSVYIRGVTGGDNVRITAI
jgi:hypothetical protein